MPGYQLDAGFLQETGHAPVQASDDTVFPGDGLGEIEHWLCSGNPERAAAFGGARNRFVLAGRVDQGFRGNAADVETGAARLVGFDDDRVDAQLAGADRAGIAAGTRADDKELAGDLVHRSMNQ